MKYYEGKTCFQKTKTIDIIYTHSKQSLIKIILFTAQTDKKLPCNFVYFFNESFLKKSIPS